MKFLTVTHNPVLLKFFLSSDPSICFALVFPPLGNCNHVNVSVFVDFKLKKVCPFHRAAYDTDWDGLRDHLRGISWECISEPGASVVTAAFHGRIHVEVYVHIPHRKYQVVSLIYPSGFKLLVLL